MSASSTAIAPERLSILTFHGLGVPGRPLPEGELDVWLEPQEFCAVLDMVRDRDDVAITFDDGNRSDFEIALPALAERGLRGVFFPTAATLDEPGYLRTSDVRALADAGMEIGTHGMQHRSWRDMSAEQAQDELVAARERLEDAAGHRIDTAACPFGAYDRGALKQLRRAGYAHVMTSDGGHTSPASWLQPRNTLRRTHDLATVVRHLLHESPSRWQRLTRSGRLLLKRWR